MQSFLDRINRIEILRCARNDKSRGGCYEPVWSLSVLLLVLGLGGCGCQFANQSVVYDTVATLEVSDRSIGLALEVEDRGWAERVVYYQNVGVAHSSLYLEDPYEGMGSYDGVFARSGVDDAAAVLGPALFLVNISVLPVELIMRPPWQEQVSRSIMSVEGPVYEFESLPSGDIRDSGYPEH